MMDTYKTIQFKITMGIYRRVREVEATSEHVFDTAICHTDTFEIGLALLPLYTSELPYRLLMEAHRKAEQIAEGYKDKGDSEWWETLPIISSLSHDEWDNQPVWRGGGDVLECYKYYHDAFESVHFLKLEWQDWRKEWDEASNDNKT